MSLFTQIEEMLELQEQIKLNYGEMTEEDNAKLTELSVEMANKIDDCYRWIIESEAKVEQYNICAQPYLDASKALKNKVDRFKNEYLPSCLNMSGKDAINGELWQLKFRKPTKIVDIISEEDIPAVFKNEELVIKIDKKALLRELKAGQLIAGAELKDGALKAYFGRSK